jgi:hypothetical protein
MLKTVSAITNAIGALNYKGTWNAATNTPTLTDGTGVKGDYYVVSTGGTQTFNSIELFFGAGDWIAYNGAVWQRVDGGSDGNFANVTLTSTDAGATAAPTLDLYRDSASPTAADTLGEIEFNGEDSAGNKQQYALIHGSIISPTSGAEGGQIHIETTTAGVSTEKMIIGTTNFVINDIGAIYNVRIEGDTDANLFYTDATNSRVGIGLINPAEKLDVVGNIKLSGNLVVASGQGIDFSATAGTGTSELLADYEEGTYTVNLFDALSGGNQSATSVTGYYTKIGRQVTCSFRNLNDISTAGMTAGNTLTFSLPFTVGTTVGTGIGSCSTEVFTFGVGTTQINPQAEQNQTRGAFVTTGSGIANAFFTVAGITTGVSDIERFTLTYFTL